MMFTSSNYPTKMSFNLDKQKHCSQCDTVNCVADVSNTWSLKAVVHDLTHMNGTARSASSAQHLGNSIRTRDRSYTEPQIGGLLLVRPLHLHTHPAVE